MSWPSFNQISQTNNSLRTTRSFEEEEKKREEAEAAEAAIPHVDNGYKCRRCGASGNGKITHRTEQTRSADEGMTNIFECKACGHKWRD